MNQEFNESMVLQLQTKFPDCWFKDGHLFNGGSAIVWSGTGSKINNVDAFKIDSHILDPKGKTWNDEIHNELLKWADKNGLYWESYDAGTFLLYKS